MDALRELIQNEVQKQIDKSACIASIPCIVTDYIGNQMYKVRTLTQDAEYTLVNCSGSSLAVNDTVQVYYRGGFLSNKSAYIGAVVFRDEAEAVAPVMVYGFDDMGNIGTSKTLSRFKLQVYQKTDVLLSFNATLVGLGTDDIEFTVLHGATALSYAPEVTVSDGEKSHVSFTIPMALNYGTHLISIVASGDARCLQSNSSIYGLHIKGLSIYDMTTEDDYVYETLTSSSNPVFYKGNSALPAVPTTLNGKAVKKIRATSFGDSAVMGASIPDGVDTIE